MLPSIPNSPPELPGIVLQSKDSKSSLTVSSARIDVTKQYDPGALENIPILIDTESKFYTGLAETISQSAQIEGNVTRVGIIVVLDTAVDNATSVRLREAFLSSNLHLGQHRTELGLLDRQTWEGFEVNRWLRLMTSQQPDESNRLEAVLDFNTIPERDYNFTSDVLSDFLAQLKNKAEEEMRVFDV